MVQIRLTKKLRTEAGLRMGDLAPVKDGSSLLGNWYANLFFFERRKVLMFMNERTLFSFFEFGVKRKQILEMEMMFFKGLDRTLTLEGFDIGSINRVFAGDDVVEYTATDNRKALGNLNDLIYLCKRMISYDGGPNVCNFNEITQKLNRTPQRNLGGFYSIDIVRQLILGGMSA